MRHLEDIDDLRKEGRDSELMPGQEQNAARMAHEILDDARHSGKEAIMLVCSSKKRGAQTADLIADQIRHIDGKMKVRVSSEDGLVSLDQGEPALPEGYKPGDKFRGSSIANNIFNHEAFERGNDTYRFGDPVSLGNGDYKYPELSGYFKKYGESNKDLMMRVYELLIRMSAKVGKLEGKTKIVVVTHAQLYQVFKNLSEIAQEVEQGRLHVRTGEVPRLCWEVYQKRMKEGAPTYEANYVSVEELCNPGIVQLLRDELAYLKNLE